MFSQFRPDSGLWSLQADIATPLARQINRLMREEANSSDEFASITYIAEVLIKYEVAALLGVLLRFDAQEAQRIGYEIASNDGLGIWAQKLPEILNGITVAARGEFLAYTRAFSKKISADDSKAYSALERAREVWTELEEAEFSFARSRLGLLQFFVALRNRTRGHGATTSSQFERINGHLIETLAWQLESSPIAFQVLLKPMKLKQGGQMACRVLQGFPTQKQAYPDSSQIPDSSKLYVQGPTGLLPLPDVLLYERDDDACFFLNSRRKRGNAESDFLDYYTNEKRSALVKAFESAPILKPPSATQGASKIDFNAVPANNLPIVDFSGYVTRSKLEVRLQELLLGRTTNFVSLQGAGGVGKTTLALRCVRQIVNEEAGFDFILWFSARDVDLDDRSGPLSRRRQVSSLYACANLFAELMAPYYGAMPGSEETVDAFANCIGSGNERFLLIFDNFESFDDTANLQQFIKDHLAFPSKALITSREDVFHGDVPIEVGGMTRTEMSDLIRSTARQAGCEPRITEDIITQVGDATLGNPYAIKLVVNEFARGGAIHEVLPRAFKDEYLPALFRRTFERSDESTTYTFLMVNLSSAAHLEDMLLLCCAGRGYDYTLAKRGMLSSHLMDEPIEESPGRFVYRTSWAAEQFATKVVVGHPLQRVVEEDVELLHMLVKQLGRNPTAVGIAELIDSTVDDVMVRQRNRRIIDWLRAHDPVTAREHALFLIRSGSADPQEVRTACKSAVELSAADAELWLAWAQFERSEREFARALDLTLRAVDMLDGASELWGAARVMLGIMSEPAFKESTSFERRGAYTRSLTSRLELMKDELPEDALGTLAWLYLQTNDKKKASDAIQLGLQKNASNSNLQRLSKRLSERSAKAFMPYEA